MSNDHIIVTGIVTEALPGCKFRVKLDDEYSNKEVECTLAGKLRQNKILIGVEDHVEVRLTPYDLAKGIISWRLK